jgi:hypothetical protein
VPDAKRKILCAVIALAVVLSLALSWPWLWFSPQLRVRLVDKASGSPVSGAIVVVTWDATQFESSYRKTIEVEELVSDEQGAVTVPPWGPRVVFVGGLRSTEPVMRIAHRSYRPKILAGDSIAMWAQTVLRVPWNGNLIALERDEQHESQGYWLAVADLSLSLSHAMSGKNCVWREIPKMVGALKQMQEEYNLRRPPNVAPPPFVELTRNRCVQR